ncbi:MAG: hypothetical protein HRT88_09735, partial [Lentisphaeraceae bacterium]|nr:hypothetical protein [Lentisphaeraceae bacterium]
MEKKPVPQGVKLILPQKVRPYEGGRIYLRLDKDKFKKSVRFGINKLLVNGQEVKLGKSFKQTHRGSGSRSHHGKYFDTRDKINSFFPKKPGKYKFEISVNTQLGIWAFPPIEIIIEAPQQDLESLRDFKNYDIINIYYGLIPVKNDDGFINYDEARKFMKKYPNSYLTKKAKKRLFDVMEHSAYWYKNISEKRMSEILDILLDHYSPQNLSKELSHLLKQNVSPEDEHRMKWLTLWRKWLNLLNVKGHSGPAWRFLQTFNKAVIDDDSEKVFEMLSAEWLKKYNITKEHIKVLALELQDSSIVFQKEIKAGSEHTVKLFLDDLGDLMKKMEKRENINKNLEVIQKTINKDVPKFIRFLRIN